MPKSQDLSVQDRLEIIRLKGEGFSAKYIARQIGCCSSTVSETIRRYRNHQTVQSLRRTGRARTTVKRIFPTCDNRKNCATTMISRKKCQSINSIDQFHQTECIWRPILDSKEWLNVKGDPTEIKNFIILFITFLITFNKYL